jgi:hypothetical protein
VIPVLLALGTLPGAAHAAGSWNPETPLADPLNEASGPSIAIAPSGAGVAGWQANRPEQFHNVDAYLTSRAAGTDPFARGGTAQGVASAHAHDPADMGMTTAVDASGKAVVAWVQADFNKPFRVMAAVRPAGAAAFGPVQKLTAEDEDATFPAVAINAAGAAVLVWSRHDSAGDTWQVEGAALSDAGTQFVPLGPISDEPDDTLFANPVHVAIAPSGAAVVTWEGEGANRTPVARWASAGAGGPGFGDPHDLGSITRAPDVAAGADSSFALTWITGTGGSGATASLARGDGGSFGAAMPVASTPVAMGEVRVGLDDAGRAIVGLTGIEETSRRTGVTACTDVCDELGWLSADGQDADGLDLAVNARGDAVLAWTRSDGQADLIEASLLAHGKDWDAPRFISRAGHDAFGATVGIDGGGNVTAAWTEANVALSIVPQATGAVDGATAPDPGRPGGGGGSAGGGTPAPSAPPAPAPQPPADTAVAAAVGAAKKQTASRKGTFKAPKVSCAEACTVRLSFTARKGKKKLAAGRRTLRLAAGGSATPAIKLTKKAKALLRSKGKLALTGSVVVTDAAGNRRTFPVKAKLKAPRRKG